MFSAKDSSSTLDAGLVPLHDAQLALAQRMRCRVLLFDRGFFDNINRARLVRVFEKLGSGLPRWLHSFLTDRHIRLRFNGFSADPDSLLVGTLQGSAISPVFSIIYTSPLIHKMKQSAGTLLSMYSMLMMVSSSQLPTRGCKQWNTYKTAMGARAASTGSQQV
jgi:hypothetical protein